MGRMYFPREKARKKYLPRRKKARKYLPRRKSENDIIAKFHAWLTKDGAHLFFAFRACVSSAVRELMALIKCVIGCVQENLFTLQQKGVARHGQNVFSRRNGKRVSSAKKKRR